MRGGLISVLLGSTLLAAPAYAASRLGGGTAGAPGEAAAPASPTNTEVESADADAGSVIVVTGVRDRRITSGATQLPLSIKDTPQAVTVLDSEALKTLQIDDANMALKMITGINVQSVETNRTYYDARGFELKSMQVDGIGMPFTFNVVGPIDLQFYDRVEAVRGANGLLTGTGTPAGTINYVRRRPRNSEQASMQIKAGSRHFLRVDGDWNFALDKDARWAIRLTAGAQQRDGYLRNNRDSRTMIQAIVEGQIGDAVIATAGFSQQRDTARGVLWGALPLTYSNGEQIHYADVGASTTMDWTFWNSQARSAFGELSAQLSDRWKAKASFTRNWSATQSDLFYTIGKPDKATGDGIKGWPGSYDEHFIGSIADAQLTGSFLAGGREHELVAGVNYSRLKKTESDAEAPKDAAAWGAVPGWRPDKPGAGWTGFEVPRPNWGPFIEKQNFSDQLTRAYAVTRLSLADPLKVILGINVIDARTRGVSFGKVMDKSVRRISPYAGITFSVTPEVNLYASYSDIFEPQGELKADLSLLGPAVGRSYEVGAKGEFLGGRLLTTLALFRAEQDNLAEKAGRDPTTGKDFHRGIFARSQGIEGEITGKIGRDFTLRAGGAILTLKDRADKDVRPYMPRKTANLMLAYTPHQWEGVSVGGYAKWQSGITNGIVAPFAVQKGYTVAGLFAKAPIAPGISLALNADNITDTKYITSMKWEQGFYGAPRTFSAAVNFRF